MVKIETDNIRQSTDHIANILIIDDDPELARFMLEILAERGVRGIIANDANAAVNFLEKSRCKMVFLSGMIRSRPGQPARSQNGFVLLDKIKINQPELGVVMVAQDRPCNAKTQRQLLANAVKAINRGCHDFLIKPLERQKVESLLDIFLPNHNICCYAPGNWDAGMSYGIVGRSSKLTQIIKLAEKVAPTSVPVLISGENGTGKEMIASLMHHKSKRVRGPYIKVNCAALSDSLLESELFGHERGAFTGAYIQRKGRFEMAHGGTLLLDEITETSLQFQAKLLRILEQQDFERVGGSENIQVDIRIISTTNKDLLEEVRQERFRQDLYYRLSGIRLIVPPLRERNEDIADLVWYFLNLYAGQTERHIRRLDPAMMEIFGKYHWPGNIRQLRNVVMTSLVLGTGDTLSLADVSWLFDELQPLPQENRTSDSGEELNLADDRMGLAGIPLQQVEKRAILDTLRQTDGNQTRAAKVLGISDRTLRGKIRRYRQEKELQPAGSAS